MKRRKIGKLFVMGLLIGCLGVPTQASTLSDAKNSKKELEDNKSKAESQVSKLQQKQKKLEASIKKLDKKMSVLDTRLNKLTNQLEDKRTALANTKEELVQAKEDEKNQYTAMKKRLKYMYESGDTNYLDILFQAKSIGDLLNRTEYVAEIAEYDNTMLDRLETARKKIATTEKRQEQEVKEVKELKSEVQQQRKEVKALVADKKSQIKEYEASIKKKKSLISAYEKQIDQQEKKIIQLEEEARKKAEEEAKAKQESNTASSSDTSTSSSSSSSNSSGSGFTWPAPSSHTITSPYGYRTHPILGTKKFHSGIDIVSSYGSSIVAADSGTVIAASYNSSMGNYVMIDHGGGITTVYMHASSLLVSSGQKVSKGQQIARVGSTGRSTGPHLHFSVMKNGSYVSPWGYL